MRPTVISGRRLGVSPHGRRPPFAINRSATSEGARACIARSGPVREVSPYSVVLGSAGIAAGIRKEPILMRPILPSWQRTAGFVAGIAGLAAFARGQDLLQTSPNVIIYS